MTRQQLLDTIRRDPEVAVLIVGAGINGIGTFRDLALQGVDVLIVDKGDFCSGASAASSHMVHGGIRYLENGEFRLVREAVKERNLLIQNAPHYVKPLPTTIPMFKWFSGLLNAPLKFIGLLDRPAERGALVIKIGLMLYDAYTGRQRAVPRHHFILRSGSLEEFPRLNPDIICTATYYDGAMPVPERICVELLLDAEASHERAGAINYLRVERAEGNTVFLRDEISGETFAVKPKIVVNAAGPWIDLANRTMSRETHFIGGTKGSHIVLDHAELRAAIGEHEFFFENKDGRIVLLFPLMDKVLVGTSDIRIDDLEEARCTEGEIEYFLELTRKVFPDINVDRSHIVFHFSGVRPLPATDMSFTGQISRDHSVKVVEPGDGIDFPIYSLVGGKWTSFRAFSEQVTDKVLDYLGIPRKRGTENLAIGGGRNYPHTQPERVRWLGALQEMTGLSGERLETLFERYGIRAEEVAAFLAGDDDEPLRHKPDYTRREISFLTLHEKVVHLDDLVLRRSLLAMLGELSPDLIAELAEVVGKALNWSEGERRAEIARTFEILADWHGVVFDREEAC